MQISGTGSLDRSVCPEFGSRDAPYWARPYPTFGHNWERQIFARSKCLHEVERSADIDGKPHAAECIACAVDGGNASHSACFYRNRMGAVKLNWRRRVAPQPPSQQAPVKPALHRELSFFFRHSQRTGTAHARGI
jgi:hypothetical protein